MVQLGHDRNHIPFSFIALGSNSCDVWCHCKRCCNSIESSICYYDAGFCHLFRNDFTQKSTTLSFLKTKLHWNLLKEYKNRGMFCGWPNQHSDDWLARKIKLSELPFHYVRKYHGYAFSWAVIYTFWYHPMENTYGHMLGFIHTFLVMIQGSLIYQKIHLNKYWRLLLECWVWFHGFSVAVMVAKEGNFKIWFKVFNIFSENFWEESAPFIFGYGFGTLFFLTQLYGLPFWYKINPYFRLIPAICWIIFAVTVVVAVPAIPNSYLGLGLGSIPAGQWACSFAAWLILLVLFKCMPNR